MLLCHKGLFWELKGKKEQVRMSGVKGAKVFHKNKDTSYLEEDSYNKGKNST